MLRNLCAFLAGLVVAAGHGGAQETTSVPVRIALTALAFGDPAIQPTALRMLASQPALALLVASRSADNDVSERTGLPQQNVGGRTLGEGQGSGCWARWRLRDRRRLERFMAFYGLAWWVYLNIVARGQEVEFGKNAAVDMRFGAHVAPQAVKLFLASAP